VSVLLLATGWTVRGSNTVGGEIFRTRPYRPWIPPTSYTMGTVPFPAVKRPGRGVHPHPYLLLWLKSRARPLLLLWAFVARPSVGGSVIYVCVYMCVCVRVCVALCPRQGRDVFLLSRKSRLALGPHPASFSVRILDLLPLGVKWSERESDHLLQSCADLKNECSYASNLLLLILHIFIAYTGTASGVGSRTGFRCFKSNAVPNLKPFKGR
jgi:hypothetical protein